MSRPMAGRKNRKLVVASPTVAGHHQCAPAHQNTRVELRSPTNHEGVRLSKRVRPGTPIMVFLSKPSISLASSHVESPHLRRDARRYALRFQALLLISTAIFISGGLGWLPLFVAIPLLVVVYARFVVVVHETTHCISPQQAPLLVRVMPALLGPIVVGFRESWYLHHRHHAELLGAKDPDRHMTDCGPIEGYLRAVLYPEYFVWYQLAHRGLEPGHLVEIVLRGLSWAVLLAWLPFSRWFWLWLTVRLTFGLSYFLLAWYLHRDGPKIGTFRKQWPAPLHAVLSLLGGRAAVNTLLYHDIHHHTASIDAEALHLVADSIPYDPSAAVRGRV